MLLMLLLGLQMCLVLRLLLLLRLHLLRLFILAPLVAALLLRRLLLLVLVGDIGWCVSGTGCSRTVLLIGLLLLRLLGLLLLLLLRWCGCPRCSGGRESQVLRPLSIGLHLGEHGLVGLRRQDILVLLLSRQELVQKLARNTGTLRTLLLGMHVGELLLETDGQACLRGRTRLG